MSEYRNLQRDMTRGEVKRNFPAGADVSWASEHGERKTGTVRGHGWLHSSDQSNTKWGVVLVQPYHDDDLDPPPTEAIWPGFVALKP